MEHISKICRISIEHLLTSFEHRSKIYLSRLLWDTRPKFHMQIKKGTVLQGPGPDSYMKKGTVLQGPGPDSYMKKGIVLQGPGPDRYMKKGIVLQGPGPDSYRARELSSKPDCVWVVRLPVCVWVVRLTDCVWVVR